MLTRGEPRSRSKRRAGEPVGIVDYTLAKRALLRNFRQGLLSKLDICDAHPELIRAARYLGEDATSPCPVCKEWELRLLAYVYGDGQSTDIGRAFEIAEAKERAAGVRNGACYVVEVCVSCSWNHLHEAIRQRSAV